MKNSRLQIAAKIRNAGTLNSREVANLLNVSDETIRLRNERRASWLEEYKRTGGKAIPSWAKKDG